MLAVRHAVVKGDCVIFKKILVSLLLIILFCGCSMKFYDSDNPEEYDRYWKNERHKKDSILYRIVGEKKEDRPGELRDLQRP